MGQSAEDLRHDIAGTRAQLSDTVEAIGDRISPSRVVERRKNRMVGGVRSAKDRIMGTVGDGGHAIGDGVGGVVGSVRDAPDAVKSQAQGNPLAAGAVAFGIGFIVAAALPSSGPEERAAGQLLDKAEPVKQQLAEAGHEVVDSLKESAAESAQQVKQAATDAGQEVKATAQDAAATSKDAAQEARSSS